MAPNDVSPFLSDTLPSEVSVITPIGSPPDAEGYTQVVEELLDERVFNPTGNDTGPTQTHRIVISGVKVVISASKTPALYQRLNNRKDLADLVIHAFEVEIHSPLNLAGTHVHIRAESLKITGDGLINTSPPPFDVPADTAAGATGNPAGDIYLQVNNLEAPGPQDRLCVLGGAGQDAMQGERGADGKSVPVWDGKISTPTNLFGSETLNWSAKIAKFSHQPVQVTCYPWDDMRQSWLELAIWMQVGTPQSFGSADPTDGNPPKTLPGAPGIGGRGGTVVSNDASWLIDVSTSGLGEAGKKAADLAESPAGTPRSFCHVDCAYAKYIIPHFKAGSDGNGNLNMKWDDDGKWSFHSLGTTKPYPVVKAPDAPEDTKKRDGGFVLAPFIDKFRPLPILALQAIISYARDGFRAGASASVREMVRYNLAKLEMAEIDWGRIAKADGTTVDDAIFPIEYQTALSELRDLLINIDGPFDYFDNQVGWVPALSLLGNLAAFESETNDAISRLYLAYWMEHNQASRANRIDAIETAVGKLDEEIELAQTVYKIALAEITRLGDEEKKLSAKVDLTVGKIAALEADLRVKVAGDLQFEHMIRAAGKILGGIAQVIPVGQPALGAVGIGLSKLADWDSDKPFDSIADIGSAVWSSDLVGDKLLPWATDKAKSYLDISSADDASSKDLSDFDKEKAKSKLSSKVKKAIADEAEAKKQITGALSSLMVSQDEIDAALAKALADCPEYVELAEEVVKLNARSQEFAAALMAAANAIQQATRTIVTARLTQIEMRGSVANIAQGLSPEALSYTRDMRMRALERLHRYQYYFAASYRYLWFETPPGYDPYSTKIMQELEKILAPEDGAKMSGDDYERLGVVFQEGLKTVADHMLTYFNTMRPKAGAAGVTSRMLIELGPLELAALNGSKNAVEIDPLRLGKIHLALEDVRIFGVRVEHAELVDPPEKATEIRVRVRHPDASVLRRNSVSYKFRNTSRVWQSSVRHARGQTSILPESDDPMDLSLLRHLLGTVDKDAPLFHRPSAAGPLRIERELMDMRSGYAGHFKALTLEIQYTSKDANVDNATLLVVPTAGVGATIHSNHKDINGKADGRGMFQRVFKKGASVKLAAPEAFGGWNFMGWRMRGHDGAHDTTKLMPLITPETASGVGDFADLDTSRDITIEMDAPQMVEAVFARHA